MNKTLIVLRHELRVTLKKPSFIVFTLAVPVLILLGYGVYQGIQHWHEPTEAPLTSIGYVDHAGGFDQNQGQPPVDLVAYDSEETARQGLLSGEVREYFVIRQDYLSTGLITRYTTAREVEPPSDSVKAIRDFLLSNLIGGVTNPETLERVKNPMALSSFRLDEDGNIASDQNAVLVFFFPYVFALLLMFSLFFTSGNLLQSVAEEKENRLIEVLLSSVSARQLLTGKVVGLGVAGLIQISVWLISIRVFAQVASVNIPVLSELSIPTTVLILAVVYYVLGYLLFAAIYAGAGSVASAPGEAQGWSGLISTAAALPLILSPLIVENPNHAVAKALTFFPLTTPMAGVMRLAADGISGWELALSVALLMASIVFCIWTAAKIFRATLLMYGKRPALRDIIKVVRQA